MRSLGLIFLYALAALLGGALVAPVAWHVIQTLPADWLHGLIGTVQEMPFHRYLTRSIQISALLFLWPLLSSLHVRSMEELGLYRSHRAVRDLLIGLVAGIPAASLLCFLSLNSGAFELHSTGSLSVIPKILSTAVFVAIFEEFLFRGVILGFCRQFIGNYFAIVFSALIFSTLHFMNFPSSNPPGFEPHWASGLQVLASTGSELPPWPITGWAFATLFFAGLLLGWLAVRTGSLWASIGLHGSWIFAQQFFNSVAGFSHIQATTCLPLLGPSQCHGAVPIGLEALAALCLAGAIACFLLRNRSRPKEYSLCSE